MTTYTYDSIFTRLDQKIIHDYEYLIYPIAGAISWGTVFGIKGVAIGTILGSIDSAAIYYYFYDHPYLTYGSIGIAVSSPLKDSPIVKELINKVESLNVITSTPSIRVTPVILTPPSSPVKGVIRKSSLTSGIFLQESLGNFIYYLKESLKFYTISISSVDLAGFITGVILSSYTILISADIFYNIFSNAIVLYNLGTRDNYKEISQNRLPSPQQLFLFGLGLGIIDAGIVYFNYNENFVISPIIKIFSFYDSFLSFSWSAASYIYLNPIFNIGLAEKITTIIPNWQLLNFNFYQTPKFISELTKVFFIFSISLQTYITMQNRFSYSSEKKFTPIQVSNKLQSIYSRMIPKREMNEILDRQIITLIATKFLVISAALKIDANRGVIASKISSGVSNLNLDSIISDCINVAFAIVYFYTSNIIDHFTSDYFQEKRKYYSSIYFTEAIGKDEIAIYLSRNNSDHTLDSKVLIRNINKNLLIVSRDGSDLLTSSVSIYIGGVYALNFFYNNEYDCMYFSYLYSIFAGVISNFFSERETKNDNIIKECREKIEALENFRVIHASSTSITGKGHLLKDKTKFYKDRLNIFVLDQTKFYSLNYIWNSVQDLLYYFLSVYIAAGHSSNQKVSKHIWTILPLSIKLFKMSCYEATIKSKLNNFDIAYNNLELLLTRIEYATNFSYPDLEVSYVYSNRTAICIENLYINLTSQKEIYIPNLCITQAKTALVGSNGCGKTTFCKLLKKVPNFGIFPTGKIIFYSKHNNSDKIIMTSQTELMTPELSILEEINSRIGEISYKDECIIKDLLKEIKINFLNDSLLTSPSENIIFNDLDKPNSWENILSGGQKNKIFFIRTIFQAIKNPMIEFIIFDEIFEHMDSKSKEIAKFMIDKYLSDRKVIIIDHNCNKNEDHFYHQKITFKNINSDSNYSVIVENYLNYSQILDINDNCFLIGNSSEV